MSITFLLQSLADYDIIRAMTMFDIPMIGVSGESLFNAAGLDLSPIGISGSSLFNPVENLDRTPVDSSYLRSVGYEEDDGIMEVEFRDGAIYEYDVPYEGDFWDLMDADSKGQKFYYDFRTSVPYRKVKDRDQ